MAGFQLKVRLDGLSDLQSHIQKMIDRGENTRPLMENIAAYGLSSTQARFKTGTSPDGQKWEKSARVEMNQGGQTLVDTGAYLDSFTADADENSASWGTNKIQARILQFGGTIKAKSAEFMTFKIPGLGFRKVKQVTIPARPHVGINDDDREEIGNLILDYFGGVAL